MSTDGTINIEFPRNMVYPRLEFACAHPDLLKQWQEILERIGIKSYTRKLKITWSKIKGLAIKQLESIERFIDIGGFIDDVKITGKSKYYNGVSKNELLNLVFSMNEHSFQFPEDLDIKDKNRIIREMIHNTLERKKWWKIGVEYPIFKKKREKELIREMIVSFVKQEVENNRYPTYQKITKKFKINIQHHFGSLKAVYECAGVKNRREVMKNEILDYVEKSARNHNYPSGEKIDKKFHTNFRQYFDSIIDVYNKAGVVYPRAVKSNMKFNTINLFI